MDSQIFSYLKRKQLTDTRTVNRLFVSSFVSLGNLQVVNNHIIRDLLISEEDKDFDLLQEFMAKIRHFNPAPMTIEDMIALFEFVVSPADRIVTGAVYTPKHVREIIIGTCLRAMPNERMQHVRVADIACGCGGFLMDLALILHNYTGRTFGDIYLNSIYGIDVQDYSVERTKILLSLLALLHGEDSDFDFNILQADTLDFNTAGWNRIYTHFDVIVGNPPYVCSRNVDAATKEKMLRYEVCLSGHPDLYIPFFQIATEMLNSGGRLGFITMNSFIRSVNGRAVRNYFSCGIHDISIVDFRGYQIFQKKSTYTCLFFLTKNQASDMLHYAVNENGDLSTEPVFTHILYSQLDNKNGWRLNDFNAVRQMESVGIPIGKYCQSRHGIATLSNKTYIFKPVAEDDDYYYLESENSCFPIEKAICRNVVNSNRLNSEVSFESIIEKLIFPYSINEGRATIIEESVMQTTFPYTYAYLSSKREHLSERDKGKAAKYPVWYEYGRTQSLIMPRYKLFIPKFANKPLNCVLRDDADMMLYNGIAFVSDDFEKLKVLKSILDSDIFWNYIVKNAKPYSTGYYSLSGVDIKNFSIPNINIE